jgi:hypothetical protein
MMCTNLVQQTAVSEQVLRSIPRFVDVIVSRISKQYLGVLKSVSHIIRDTKDYTRGSEGHMP